MFIPREGREALIGQRVRIYRNLHNHLFSIKKGSLVLGYCDAVTLKDVSFPISKAGQEKARRDHRRNVHAYVEGVIASFAADPVGDRLTYDPFTDDTFKKKSDGSVILRADELRAVGQACYVS